MKWAGLETPKCVTVHQRVKQQNFVCPTSINESVILSYCPHKMFQAQYYSGDYNVNILKLCFMAYPYKAVIFILPNTVISIKM